MASVEVPVETAELPEIQNMKVADLKKKLKAIGLPITGNKNELADRLRDAYLSGKEPSNSQNNFNVESSQSTHISYNESELKFTDSLELLEGSKSIEGNSQLEQEEFTSYVNSALETDSSKALGEGSVISKANLSSDAPKPLKKRVIVKNPVATPAVTKKIQLNRTPISFADLYPLESPAKTSGKTPIRIDTESTKVTSRKNLSESEKLALRAKRFNITNDVTTTTTNTKFSKVNNSKPVILPSSASGPEVDVLKKRAQRFGQSVSTVLKQIEDKEKLLKRKFKFGASVSSLESSSLDDESKKLKRAKRFGVA